MYVGVENWLRHLNEQYGDRLLTLLTVLLMLLMFVLAPLQATGMVAFQILGIIVGVGLIGGALVVSGSATAFVILLIALIINISVVVSRLLHGPSKLQLYLLAGAWLIFAVTLAWIVAKAVFGPGRVSYHRIIGAIFLYFLIALTFSALFILISLLIPNSISGIKIEDTPALASNLFYFNFVTLTSTGYGDILPIHPIARSLANLETIIGQFYPATLLARLVTLEVEGRR